MLLFRPQYFDLDYVILYAKDFESDRWDLDEQLILQKDEVVVKSVLRSVLKFKLLR